MIPSEFLGFLGVFIGAIITVFSQFLLQKNRERHEYRNRFIVNSKKLAKLICDLKESLNLLYRSTDDTCINDDYIDYFYSSMVKSGKIIVSSWFSFKYFLFAYFYRQVKNKDIDIFNRIIIAVGNLKSTASYEENGTPDYEKTYQLMYKIMADFKEHRDDLCFALKFINSIDLEFNKLLRKKLRRNF